MFFYDLCWKTILNDPYIKQDGKEHYLGAFVGWDNTPRKNKNGLLCMGDSSLKAFGYFFRRLVNKAEINECKYIFINAWNEWAEGAYLEPDEKYGYGYLDEIRRVIESDDE